MTIYNQIDANKRRTWVLLILSVLFVTSFGYILGEVSGYGMSLGISAFVYSLISAFFSYYFSDKVALSMSKARPITENDDPRLYHIVENLCIGSGLPLPKIHVIDDPALNAFATGRDPKHASIVVTTGLLAQMDKLELEGVVAHELSHIQNYDIRVMTLVVVLVGTIAVLAEIFMRSLWFGGDRDRKGGGALILIGVLVAILSPLVAQLIKMAISRRREYLADASGVLITRYPAGLASALEKIGESKTPLASASSATAHLFISNPFKTGSFQQLFSTHPPLEERIKRLRAM